jgi:carboxylate-amine ligase
MIDSGTVLDPGMVYFDARLSQHYPTVEIRVADVCLDAAHALLLAALARALVETAARAWAAGQPPQPVRMELLRLAAWRAGRSGLDGDLVDPRTLAPAPARTVLDALLAHVHDALEDSGELTEVRQLHEALWRDGTGAARQRATYARTGTLADVVADSVRRTHDE